MSATHDVEEARRLLRQLEETEAKRVGRLAVARERVSQRIGISPGMLDELRRGRRKSVAGWISSSLRAAVEKELRREIFRLEHELEILRLRGGSLAANEISKVASLLDQAKRLMGD